MLISRFRMHVINHAHACVQATTSGRERERQKHNHQKAGFFKIMFPDRVIIRCFEVGTINQLSALISPSDSSVHMASRPRYWVASDRLVWSLDSDIAFCDGICMVEEPTRERYGATLEFQASNILYVSIALLL